MNLRELINTKRLYLDGGTGTMLQKRGLKSGEGTEEWSITHPDEIIRLHREYLTAGSDIFCTNTFSVNCLKQNNYEEYIKAAFECAHKAREGFENKFIAFDLGPTGRLLRPLGDLDFEDAVEVFAKNVRLAAKYGADLIMIETMNDLYETKAAVIAAKENCDLPIFVSNAYGEDGKLMTGADADTVITTLASLGVDAIGLNCSFGPDKMLPVVKKYAELSPLPIIVKPNAGLPRDVDGKTVFDVLPDEYHIRAMLHAQAHSVRKNCHRFFKIKITIGFQQSASRANIQGNDFFLFARAGCRRRFCIGDGSSNDFFQLFGIEFQAVCAKGIGVDDICACIKIALLQLDDDFRVFIIPAFGMFTGL